MFFRKILQKESADFILVTDEKPKKNKVKCQEKWRGPAYRPRRTGHLSSLFSLIPATRLSRQSIYLNFQRLMRQCCGFSICRRELAATKAGGAWAHEPYIVKGEEPRSFTFQVHLLGRGKGCIHSRFRKECQTRKNVRLLQTKKGFL